jgi:hypothetical protein
MDVFCHWFLMQVARGSVVEIPLWLAQDLHQRQIVHVKLPSGFSPRFVYRLASRSVSIVVEDVCFLSV